MEQQQQKCEKVGSPEKSLNFNCWTLNKLHSIVAFLTFYVFMAAPAAVHSCSLKMDFFLPTIFSSVLQFPFWVQLKQKKICRKFIRKVLNWEKFLLVKLQLISLPSPIMLLFYSAKMQFLQSFSITQTSFLCYEEFSLFVCCWKA